MPARSRAEPPAERRRRTAAIVRRLLRSYPPDHPARPGGGSGKDPLSELIFTLLSQNTSDVNRDRAWSSMRKRFPRWHDVTAAPLAELASSIQMGGLAKTKAPRIQAILREIEDREGRLSLARLRRMGDEDVIAYLGTLPGIGPKTIACVMAFSLGRPALPVDTHVHRVAGRLGLIGERDDPLTAQRALEDLVPPRHRVETHLALIAHGRTTCTARRPACERCPLATLCPWPGNPVSPARV